MRRAPRAPRHALLFPIALAGLGLAPGPAAAFSLFADFSDGTSLTDLFRRAPRWSSVSGLDDGIQVGVQPGFAEALTLEDGDPALTEQALIGAIRAWENPALRFDIVLDAPVAEGPSSGLEIDFFAVPDSHPIFADNDFFGFAAPTIDFFASRPLTNGQTFAGYAITGADVYLNIDQLLFLRALGDVGLDVIVRVTLHEFGHAIGLGHPNADNPFGSETNYDTDFDPTNAMVVDPLDPFADLRVSSLRDEETVMSNAPCGLPPTFCPASAYTELQNDDLGGRDVLYPAVPEPASATLLALGTALLGLRLGSGSATARAGRGARARGARRPA